MQCTTDTKFYIYLTIQAIHMLIWMAQLIIDPSNLVTNSIDTLASLSTCFCFMTIIEQESYHRKLSQQQPRTEHEVPIKEPQKRRRSSRLANKNAEKQTTASSI